MKPDEIELIKKMIAEMRGGASDMAKFGHTTSLSRKADALSQALADADALAVERQKVRWLGLVCEATSLHGRRALEKTSNGWMVHRQGMDPLKGPEIFCEWSGSIADGYSHVDALEAAMEGGRG